MGFSITGKLIPIKLIQICVSLLSCGVVTLAYAAEEIQFNSDILDVDDRKNIDLSQFSRGSYIMPGNYSMVVRINNSNLPERMIPFYATGGEQNKSLPCISPELADQLGFKQDVMNTFSWWHNDQCLDVQGVQGMETRGDIATNTLYVSVPQAFLEYTADNWDPPSRWEEGIPGVMLDYNVNALFRQPQHGSSYHDLSGNGTAGANLGAWRFRADWQATLNQQSGTKGSRHQFDWSRYYAYRAIKPLRSQLALGESYLNSGIFDSFRFAGASLTSDDNMLPPNLRGYAPEVVGVAKTNAKVTVSQQGRVLYQTTVAAGPFRIQDINDSVSGELNVQVEEQDGTQQHFTVNTANIPYLTRPGQVRFKLAMGKPADYHHHVQGPAFATGEFSWGVNSGWSLYGGGLVSSDYNALSVGIGRDLMLLGALSFDVTQSRATLPEHSNTLRGGSYRLSYSKHFDEYDSQITFAGYRFSEREFMSMSDYLDARYNGFYNGSGKEMYTLSFNKSFRDWGVNSYINYSHETYWDQSPNDRYNLSVSRYFDIGRFRNVSVSITAYRNQYRGIRDDGGYLSLSMPWGSNGSLSYNATVDRKNIVNRASYYQRVNEHDNYQLSAGSARSGVNVSGYYSHAGDIADLTANASYQEGGYSAAGLSAQGGVTLTTQGGAFHRSASMGDTRMLVDTNGVAGIPVRGYGSTTRSNRWGKAVISDINSYYRNQASIDLNQLGENADARNSVVEATLTEGAIGYRQFNVVAGSKAMAVITLADGSSPPFGAVVMNQKNQETGLVNDNGSVYLSGILAGEKMKVHWNDRVQCEIHLPDSLPTEMLINNLLLPCRPLSQPETE